MGQGGRIGYYITGRQSKAGGYTHDYTGIQDSQAYVGFVGIWKMCDLHLDFTSAGGGCGTVWLLGAGVCAAPPAVPRRAVQVVAAAADSSCRWLRTSARNLAYSEEGREKLSRRKREWHSSAYHCAPWHSFDDIVAQLLVKEKRGSYVVLVLVKGNYGWAGSSSSAM